MPINHVAANKEAPNEWAAKRKEQLERAAAIREERMRAAMEMKRLAEMGEACSSDPQIPDQPAQPPAWWENRDPQVEDQESHNICPAPNHMGGRPSKNGNHAPERRQRRQRRKQWSKPDVPDWQPVTMENISPAAGQVLYQRPDPQQPQREPTPPVNVQLLDGVPVESSLHLDDATATWLAMLRPDDGHCPEPAPRNPPARRAGKEKKTQPTAAPPPQQNEEMDDATKAFMGMLRADPPRRAPEPQPRQSPGFHVNRAGHHQRDKHLPRRRHEFEPSECDEQTDEDEAEGPQEHAWEISPPPLPRQAPALKPQEAPQPRQQRLYRAQVSSHAVEEGDRGLSPPDPQGSLQPPRRCSSDRQRGGSRANSAQAGPGRRTSFDHSGGASDDSDQEVYDGAARDAPPPVDYAPAEPIPRRHRTPDTNPIGSEVKDIFGRVLADWPVREAPSHGRRSTSPPEDPPGLPVRRPVRVPSAGRRAIQQPLAAQQRAPEPWAPPQLPSWADEVDAEPRHALATQQEMDRRPVRRRVKDEAEELHLQMPEDEEDPWYAGVNIRKARDVKPMAGRRRPARAPMNPQVAGENPTSPGGGRKGPKDKFAPLRKSPGGGVKKIVGKKDEDPCTRQMVDKRQSRKDNSPSFMAAVDGYRQGLTDLPPKLEKILATKAARGLTPKDDALGVPVYLRKRPLFAHEVKRRDYDVISVDSNHHVVIHNCQMHADLKRMHIMHRAYPCARAFDEKVSNNEVYDTAGAPLIEAAANGGQGALFMYGQTGSGKTFTMSAIEKDGMHHLFDELVAQGGSPEVRIAIFEIAGKKCVDLLQNGQKEVMLKETEGGAVELMGADEPVVYSAEEALELVAEAKSRRATASTSANATSSRSHCVTRITVWGSGGQGQLTLVDCAGSERNNDSMHHDAQARKECAEINASLYALRECIRLRRRQTEEARQPSGGKHVHVPYRSSQLTRVLMECFTSPDAEVAVIATVSPSATDTEHSMSTLQTVLMMAGASKDAYAEVKEDVPLAGAQKPPDVREVKPVNWTAEEVRKWLSKIKKGAYSRYVDGMPGDINGRALVRMNKQALAQVCAGGSAQGGLAIFNAIRNEIERVDKVMRQQRRGVVETNARLKSGW